MHLAQRDHCRKTLVQYYAKLRTAGASERRARELTAQKAHTLGAECAKMVNVVIAQVEGEES